MNVICIYNANLDGALSAGIVMFHHNQDEVTVEPWNPEIPLDWLSKFDLVYVVGLPVNQFYQPIHTLQNLIWIDHHKVPFANCPIQGRRDFYSGSCELTWQYLFPDTITPKLIKYVSAYMTGNYWEIDKTKATEIYAGCMKEYGLNPEDLCNYFRLAEIGLNDYLGYLRNKGKAIIRAKKLKGKRL